MAQQGQIKPAIAHYFEAQRDYKEEISSRAWNTLCWFGSLYGDFVEVKEACTKAVTLEPENKWYRRARGLNNALIGDIQGAIDDLQFFVSQSQLDSAVKLPEQHWLGILQQGENPFISEEIDKLKKAPVFDYLTQQQFVVRDEYKNSEKIDISEKIDRLGKLLFEKLLEDLEDIDSGTRPHIIEPVLN